MGAAWDKVTGMQEKKKGSSPALAGSEKTLRPRERFTGTEARLGLKSLWVQLQRAGCCGCRLGGVCTQRWWLEHLCLHWLGREQGVRAGWQLARGKTHFFPSCPPEAPSVRVGWKWEECRARGNASALAGRVG